MHLIVHQLATEVVLVITDRQRSCGKVMFSQASVCSQGGRVSLVLDPFCGVGYPWYKVLSRWGCRVSLVPGPFCGLGYPWYQVLSGGRISLGEGGIGGEGRPLRWSVRILLECFLIVCVVSLLLFFIQSVLQSLFKTNANLIY